VSRGTVALHTAVAVVVVVVALTSSRGTAAPEYITVEAEVAVVH